MSSNLEDEFYSFLHIKLKDYHYKVYKALVVTVVQDIPVLAHQYYNYNCFHF